MTLVQIDLKPILVQIESFSATTTNKRKKPQKAGN